MVLTCTPKNVATSAASFFDGRFASTSVLSFSLRATAISQSSFDRVSVPLEDAVSSSGVEVDWGVAIASRMSAMISRTFWPSLSRRAMRWVRSR